MKTKVVRDLPHLGKKQGEWYVNKKCNHANNEVVYSKKIVSQLLNKFKEGLRGSRVESNNNLLKFYTYYNRALKALKSLFSFLNVPLLPKRH
jgi:hypothetical protein